MKFVQVPGGEYYLQRDKNFYGAGTFIFLPRWIDNKKHVYGVINLGKSQLRVPRELVGKRFRVKLELVE